MAFFFLVAGLEARREFDLGELRERRRLALPLVVALGGMVAPIAIYLVCRLAARNVDAIAPVSLNGQALCPCRGCCPVRTRVTYAPSPPCSALVPGRVGACGSAAACL